MMRVTKAAAFLPLVLVAQTVDDGLAAGIREFQRGQYAAAQASLQKALSRNPSDAHARTFLALARAAAGGCNAVAGELKDQFEKNADADLRRLSGLALVQCYLARDQYEEAAPVVARLRMFYPSDPDVLYEAAKLHMKAWNAVVFEMFQKTPASYRVNQLSAEIFEIQGRYPEAAAEYRKAIAKNATAVNLHFRLGRALLLESHAPEKLAEARKEFEAELALSPNDPAAEYEIAQILLLEQKPSDARAHLERAIELSPDFSEALLALGKLALTQKREHDAIRLLERVVALQPKNEAARYSLMTAYRNAGRTGEAMQQKSELEKLQRPPEGEFTEFLKKLGEKAPKP